MRKRSHEDALAPAIVAMPSLDSEPAEEICSICLSELSCGDSGATQCGHKFHAACLATWVGLGHHSCPECRECIGSASRSRMFAPPAERPRPGSDGMSSLRMPRFHGG